MFLQQENDPAHPSQQTFERTPPLALRVGSHQDPGIRRKYRPNEDSLLVTHSSMPCASSTPMPFVLLAMADGMGGQEHGRTASRIAARTLASHVTDALRHEHRSPTELLQVLAAGVQLANRCIYEHNQRLGTDMGTTLTAALVSEASLSIAHVGDSRLYLYREQDGLTQVTRDHSVVATLVTAGIIAPDDIYTHPWRNQIYRSLGEKASVEVDVSIVPIAASDMLLLCSDGLWEMVRDRQIAAILSTAMAAPADTAHALVQAALAGGGMDNVSVIVGEVSNV